MLIQAGAPIAAQADDPCQTPNVAPTFLPRDSHSTPQPTRTPLPYDPCAPTATRSTSATVFASTPTPALPPVIPTPQLATNGLFGRYFTDTITQGGFDNFHATRLDSQLNFFWQQPANPGIPDLGDCFSVRWTARLKTPLSGTYLFVVNHDDGVRLWVAGQLVVDKWQDNLFNTAHAGEIFLEANQAYPIRVELYQNCAGPAGIQLSWALPGQSTHTAIPSTQFLPELTPDTVAVYRPSDQTFYVRYHNTTGVSDEAILYGNPGDIPLVGDWNGDGLDEIGVYRPSTAQWFLRGRDGQTHSLAFGTVGDIPLVGKWNRLSNLTVNNKPYLSDGVGVFRPSTNTFYFRQTLSTGGADYSLSVVGDFAVQPSDVPMVGDWDGDGIETIGFYRPTNQRWSLSHTKPALGGSATFPTTISFGEAGGLPFTGDWLGRGSHLLGSLHAGFVEHESVGLAYTGWLDGGTQFFYGSTGDVALAGKWIARCANGDLPLLSVGCTILQALPTNTRRPTRTPEPTGTPTTCTLTILQPTIVRVQPFRYKFNRLFQLNAGGSTATIFDNPHLWSGNPPSSPSTVQLPIAAISKIGRIPWDISASPNDIEWLQVRVNLPDRQIIGYVGSTGSNISLEVGCQLLKPDHKLDMMPSHSPPVIVPSIFTVQARKAIFFNLQSQVPMPAAYIGTKGLHEGAQDFFGATLDVVPRNIELCIDTESSLINCDGLESIPIYSPVNGCAFYDTESKTLVIDADRSCSSPPINGEYLQIVMTHITNLSSSNVQAGALVGTLCKETTKSICGIDQQNSPTHLAFKLRVVRYINGSSEIINLVDYILNGQLLTRQQIREEVLGFLGLTECLFDDWVSNNGVARSRALNSSYTACPQ